MRLSSYVPIVLAVLLAAVASVGAAVVAVERLEDLSGTDVSFALVESEIEWANVDTNGLRVELTGTAPDEAERFRALSVAGTRVDASRVIDLIDVAQAETIQPPRFSLEILSNLDGVSVIGLVPRAMDRETVVRRIARAVRADDVTDLMEVADFPVPQSWDEAVAFATEVLADAPRSKVSVSAAQVSVTALTESRDEKVELERTLKEAAPIGVDLVLDISAPRPVITPFTVRFVVANGSARFDACSADTTGSRDAILDAAQRAGAPEKSTCTVGLGAPTTSWAEAIVAGIETMARIGGGTITFTDADVTILGLEDTEQAIFDREVGRLESRLPPVFSLAAILPEKEDTDGDVAELTRVPEFVAVLEEDGTVELRGRVPDEQIRRAVEGFALARFGVGNVASTPRIDETLPPGWPTRVLAGLEVLSHLNRGAVMVRADTLQLSGATGDETVSDTVSRILADRLGGGADFSVNVAYEPALAPVDAVPSPDECVRRVNAILGEGQIKFAPGSTQIEAATVATLDAIANELKSCQTVPMEIGGHTDSQGRESMNLRLSQARADTVLNEIMARRVLTSNLVAKGYGEGEPIADNESEEGREANRRIEFKLIEELPEELVAAPAEVEEVLAAPEGDSDGPD